VSATGLAMCKVTHSYQDAKATISAAVGSTSGSTTVDCKGSGW